MLPASVPLPPAALPLLAGAPIPSPGATTSGAEAYWQDLSHHLLAHDRRGPQALAALLAADPGHVRGWCVKGLAAIILARRELVAGAREALTIARGHARRSPSTVDRLYVAALERALAIDFAGAWSALDTALDHNPDDALAAKIGHSLRFMRGDAAGMREQAERVAARAAPDHPHRGYLLGMLAFAREETGDYAGAEAAGREGVALAPDDAWGIHAVAHVHEMTNAPRLGLAWLESQADRTGHCNNFAGHVFWHRALFHIELGDPAAALDLYDHAVRAEQTDDFRDLANAASLLVRLELEGVAVGGRWRELADAAERRAGDGTLVFADLHYMLALARAGRTGAAASLIGRLAGPTEDAGDQAALARDIGVPAGRGIAAFADGRWQEAARALFAARPASQTLGGSHAQRDVFERLLIEACLRGGLTDLAGTLLAERVGQRGPDRFATTRLARIDTRLRQVGAGALARLGLAAAAPSA